MKQFDSQNLPPCPLSFECLRLADELENASDRVPDGPVFSEEDARDARLLEQLRIHVSSCPTCTAILNKARHMRRQQRIVLRDLLEDSEEAVPSTVQAILAAVAQEPKPGLIAGTNHHQDIYAVPTVQLEEPQVISLEERRRQQTTGGEREKDTRRLLRNIVSLAIVAAVILSAIAAFSRFVILTPQFGKGMVPAHPVVPVTTATPLAIGWKSAAIGLSYTGSSRDAGHTVVANYDPSSGHSVLLVRSHLPLKTQLDGISHDGLNLLYQFAENGKMYYYTLASPAKTGSFYTLQESDAGNAIWMDTNYALIATVNEGVKQVNIQTGAASTVLPNLKAVHLVIYRAPYLYFTGGAAGGALNRMAISGGPVLRVTMPSTGSTFWISPDGTTVFYANRGSYGEQAIYAVSGDGTNSRVLRPGGAMPVGYAANYALMVLQEVNGKFQVIRLGATPQERETVVMNDAAPGAVSLCSANVVPGVLPICDSNAALAPYGHGLILHAYYPDGTSQILFDDLLNGQSHVLVNLGKDDIQVQLPGWDRLPVS